ncbi:tetratricopeptide repeat protein [candidate division KSB1 bacterium]
MENDRLRVVFQVTDATEAEVARTALENAGIRVMMNKGDLSGLRPHAQFMDGIQLLVHEADFELAEKILISDEEPYEMSEKEFRHYKEAEILFAEGTQLYEQRRFDEAEKRLKDALGIMPDSEDILYNLALVHLEQKKYDRARSIIEQITSIDCTDILDVLRDADRSFADFCPACAHYGQEDGICYEFHENVREYPKKFEKICNGKYYKPITA